MRRVPIAFLRAFLRRHNSLPALLGGVFRGIMNPTSGLSSPSLIDNFKWLNTKEAAEYLRTNPKQIRKWVYEGKLKAYKLFSKSLRFKRQELDLLLEGGRKCA